MGKIHLKNVFKYSETLGWIITKYVIIKTPAETVLFPFDCACHSGENIDLMFKLNYQLHCQCYELIAEQLIQNVSPA